MNDEPEFDNDDELDENEEPGELTGDEAIIIDVDNIHNLVETLHQETPCFPIEDIYRFILTREIFGQEITLKDFTEKFNKHIEGKVEEALLEMARDGEVEMNLEGDDFTFGNVPKDLFNVKKSKKKKRRKK